MAFHIFLYWQQNNSNSKCYLTANWFLKDFFHFFFSITCTISLQQNYLVTDFISCKQAKFYFEKSRENRHFIILNTPLTLPRRNSPANFREAKWDTYWIHLFCWCCLIIRCLPKDNLSEVIWLENYPDKSKMWL